MQDLLIVILGSVIGGMLLHHYEGACKYIRSSVYNGRFAPRIKNIGYWMNAQYWGGEACIFIAHENSCWRRCVHKRIAEHLATLLLECITEPTHKICIDEKERSSAASMGNAINREEDRLFEEYKKVINAHQAITDRHIKRRRHPRKCPYIGCSTEGCEGRVVGRIMGTDIDGVLRCCQDHLPKDYA